MRRGGVVATQHRAAVSCVGHVQHVAPHQRHRGGAARVSDAAHLPVPRRVVRLLVSRRALRHFKGGHEGGVHGFESLPQRLLGALVLVPARRERLGDVVMRKLGTLRPPMSIKHPHKVCALDAVELLGNHVSVLHLIRTSGPVSGKHSGVQSAHVCSRCSLHRRHRRELGRVRALRPRLRPGVKRQVSGGQVRRGVRGVTLGGGRAPDGL
mmetsp:Transcript_33357/g.81974  ORF Transcript_33357/g.81974 Transcript_33357/m.81974 type:complete len:210 (+) Transcript_33357:799-1428(+)